MACGKPNHDRFRSAAKQVFGKMCEGRFTVFVIKGESPSNLRVAEVLKKNEDLVKVWYYVDRTVGIMTTQR